MANKKQETIDNFSVQAVAGISVDLMRIETTDDEGDEVFIFNPILNLHFEIESLEGGGSKTTKLIATPTSIFEECPHCAVTQVLDNASILFDSEITFDSVTVFDEDGGILDELSLDDMFDDEEEETAVSDKKYDLASMQIGVPVIQ